MQHSSVSYIASTQSLRSPPLLYNEEFSSCIDTKVASPGNESTMVRAGSEPTIAETRNTTFSDKQLIEIEASLMKNASSENSNVNQTIIFDDEAEANTEVKVNETEVEREGSLSSKTSSTQESQSTIPNEAKLRQSRASQNIKRKDKVIINVGGKRHLTYRSTLRNIPDTRLSWLADGSAIHSADYDRETGEFYFDRHPTVFSHILNYYRTGKLHVPYDVCGPLYEEELQFWGIDDSQVESCCWISYRQHRDAQDTLKDFEGIEFDYNPDDDSEPDLARYGFQVDFNDEEHLTRYQKWLQLRPKIWSLFDDPSSSKAAKVLAYISMVLIVLSVMLFCLETTKSVKDNGDILLILEGVCVAWFTIELSVRFIVCPSRLKFIKDVMNWIDFLAIIPFFIELIFDLRNDPSHKYLQVVRVIRVFRIIKLSKHNVGLQILGHTLKASFRELLLLIFFLGIGIVIFASLVYYCEKEQKDTKFASIPMSFWWAVITMTTVGYGDMAPTTPAGQLIGSLCAVSGVLMIALPVPVIVNNFNLYYSHAQARLKLPKKKRKVLVNAANALKDSVDLELQQTQLTDDVAPSDDEESKDNSQHCTVMITGDQENLSADDMDSTRLRMQKFGRRDSKLFGEQCASGNNNDSGRLTTVNGGTPQNYALQKRRSLMPGMSALPEID